MLRLTKGPAVSGGLIRGMGPKPAVLCVVLALAAGGCTQTTRKVVPGWAMNAVGAPMATAHVQREARPDMEADGMEAQAAPRARSQAETDDPNEPYSPNYGARANRMPSPSPEQIQHAAPPSPRPTTTPPAAPVAPASTRKRVASAEAE